MKNSLKTTSLALLVAIGAAAALFSYFDPTRTHLAGEFAYYFFSILVFGLPLYLPYALLHSWLLQKISKRTLLYAILLGVGLAIGLTLLGMLFHSTPDDKSDAMICGLTYGSAGAIYGLVYRLAQRHSQPASD